jgi:uncharacterized protein YndB with AHSA1/START domain
MVAASRFEYLIYIRTTAQELWRGLTAPEMTRQYWCETWQDCRWTVGAPWRLMTPDGRVGDAGEVLEIEAEKRVVLSWRHELMPEFRAEGFSRCAILLEPHEGAMKLSLTHEIEKADSKLIAAFATGWPPILSSLKSLLETGESLELTRKWPEGM